MDILEQTEANELKQEPGVKRAQASSALEQQPQEQPVLKPKARRAVGVYLVILIAAGVLYYLVTLKVLVLPNRYLILSQKLSVSLLLSMVVLLLARLTRSLLYGQIGSPAARYNLKRVIDLVSALLILFIAVSVLFVNWYAAIVSLGLISLVLGLALQNPISSFFAWIYIMIRRPYKVGDRIRIGQVTGDVIELNYFDTTLWEFGGDYLSGDHPSGRIIRFTNSKVFNEYVYNYSWPLFPYLWNEIKFYVAYESDLAYVEETIKKVVEAELGEAMMRRVRVFRNVLSDTPVDELEVRERPSVIFRGNPNTWVEVVVRYVVESKESGRVKNRLFKRIIGELRQQPGKVLFPKSDMR